MRRLLHLLCVSPLLVAATALAQPRPPRNRPAPGTQRPAVDAGAPAEAPDVPAVADPLQRALEGRREAFLACYEAARAERPGLQGPSPCGSASAPAAAWWRAGPRASRARRNSCAAWRVTPWGSTWRG